VRVDHPRVHPVPEADWDDDTRKIIEGIAAHSDGRVLNVVSTLARHPKLFKRWMPFGNHVLGGSTLPARERELVILRTGFDAGSGYEWAQHVAIARRCGCTNEEIERVAEGPDAPGWTEPDRVLLRATDELMADHFISDPTWTALSDHWNELQRIDLIFTVGQYCMISMALNSFGVQIEDDTELFPGPLFEGAVFKKSAPSRSPVPKGQ